MTIDVDNTLNNAAIALYHVNCVEAAKDVDRLRFRIIKAVNAVNELYLSLPPNARNHDACKKLFAEFAQISVDTEFQRCENPNCEAIFGADEDACPVCTKDEE